MPDEFDLDQLDNTIESENKVEKRIKGLSDKLRLTSEERDEKDKLLVAERTEKESLLKERDFLNSFGEQLGKFPEASAYKDQIKERVLKGYSVEDATAATLVANGKYNPPVVQQPVENFVGGAAAVTQHVSGEKALNQLSRDEKRAKLVEAEQRGDLGVN